MKSCEGKQVKQKKKQTTSKQKTDNFWDSDISLLAIGTSGNPVARYPSVEKLWESQACKVVDPFTLTTLDDSSSLSQGYVQLWHHDG